MKPRFSSITGEAVTCSWLETLGTEEMKTSESFSASPVAGSNRRYSQAYQRLNPHFQHLGEYMNKIKSKQTLVSVLFLRILIFSVLCMTSALAQSPECSPPQYMDENEPERRALVIGNAIYTHHANVASATTDASRMTQRLIELNFKVDPPLAVNTKEDFSRAVENFRATIREGDLVVFYYSGHGFSYGSDGFLAPTNLPALITEKELPDAAMAVDSVRYLLESRKPGLVIMILDSCRTVGEFVIRSSHQNAPAVASSDLATDPNGSSVTNEVNLARPGLAMPRSGDGSVNSIIAFAAEHGHVAEGNNTPDEMSMFTRWLVPYLSKEGQSVLTVFADVGADVSSKTEPVQKPSVYLSSYTDPFLRPTTRNLTEDKQAWCVALSTGTPEKIQRYTKRHSVTRHAAAARRWLKEQVVSMVRGYTLVSPVAVERAWRSSTDTQVALRRLETQAFAFPRSMDGSWGKSVATATNTDVGVVPAGTTVKQLARQKTGEEYLTNNWGIDSATQADQKLAFTIASMDLHETVVTTISLVGRAVPDVNAPVVSRIPRGTRSRPQRCS